MLMLPDNFRPGFGDPAHQQQPALWFIFSGNQLLVQADNKTVPVNQRWPANDMTALRTLYMGDYHSKPCYAVEVEKSTVVPQQMQFMGLRELWGVAEEALIGLAGQAIQLVDWDRCHQFCGRCGSAMNLSSNDRSKRCPVCQLTHYPRIAPAVMVRIVRDDAILLARSPRFPPGRFSVLAGFVDPGETLEQAVHREVMEEVGLKIKNLRYFTSQSWPFPHSLMIAFSADYASGEIVLEDEEIEEADWFRPSELPGLPPPISIARRLIDDYLQAI